MKTAEEIKARIQENNKKGEEHTAEWANALISEATNYMYREGKTCAKIKVLKGDAVKFMNALNNESIKKILRGFRVEKLADEVIIFVA